MSLTWATLIDEVYGRLEERLSTEAPHPYGSGIIVTRSVRAGEEFVLVLQPGGPHFRVRVDEVGFGDVALGADPT